MLVMSQGVVTTAASEAAPTGASLPAAPVGLWLPACSLWRREMVRFFRQRNRVIGALATPLVFWLLLGTGLNRSFTPPSAAGADAAASNVGYLAYFYPGTVVLVVLFTAIFSTISVIEDRREGFLQGVLVAPIRRLSIVLGKVLGGASVATVQGVILLALWPVVGPWPGWGAMLAAVGMLFLLGLGLTGLGLCIAWPMDSTAGFHAIMNLFLMPMWFLSGAVFPIDAVPGWMAVIMRLNPLTYGHAAFAAALSGSDGPWALSSGGWCVNLAITVAFTVLMLSLSAALVGRRGRGPSA
jgi:ABC-2 type transport system permease protein